MILAFVKFNPMFVNTILEMPGCRDDMPDSSVECSKVVGWYIPEARYPVINPGIFWQNNPISAGMPCCWDGLSIKNFG